MLTLTVAPDHVYLRVRSHPDPFPSAFVRMVKRRSARFLRQEFPQFKCLPSLWTRAALYSAVNEMSEETIQHASAEQPRIEALTK